MHTRAHRHVHRHERARAPTTPELRFPCALGRARAFGLREPQADRDSEGLHVPFIMLLDRLPFPSRRKRRGRGWKRKAAPLSPLVRSSTSRSRSVRPASQRVPRRDNARIWRRPPARHRPHPGAEVGTRVSPWQAPSDSLGRQSAELLSDPVVLAAGPPGPEERQGARSPRSGFPTKT